MRAQASRHGHFRPTDRSSAVLLLLRAAVLALVGGLLVALLGSAPASAADEPRVGKAKTQRVTSELLPPIRQPGPGVDGRAVAQSVVSVSVTPPQGGGRDLVLERRTGDGWKAMATTTTNARGRAQFFVPASSPARTEYRAVAAPYRGLHTKPSRAVKADAWAAPDFVDEFSGSSLGPAWEHRIQYHNPWGGRACSKGSPAAVSVGDGVLRLSSMPDPAATELCTATALDGTVLGQYPYRLNANVSTQHSADFLYGIAAARMKFQRDPGAHAAFWLQPRGLLETGPTPWGAEIDVVEWYGHANGRDRMSSVVHAPLPDGGKATFGGPLSKPERFLASRSDAWWRDYHVFSVEWTPTEYIFRISGHEVWRTDQGISHDPEFLILSMLSSDWELPELGADQAAVQTATVDWVKFWQAEQSTTP